MAVRYNRDNGELNKKYTEVIKRKFPWIDYIVDIRDIENIPSILGLEDKKETKHISYLNIPTKNENEVVVNIPYLQDATFFALTV